MSESELKRCPFCAEQIQAAAIVCRFCNRELAGSLGAAYSPNRYPLSQTPAPSASSAPFQTAEPKPNFQQAPEPAGGQRSRNRRWIWVGVITLLTVVASLNGQNLFTFVAGTLSGQVIIDSGKVARTITQGVKDQAGLDVDVSCPSPFIGHVGDTRQCTYTSLLGPGFIDVTIQSTSGDITWVAN